MERERQVRISDLFWGILSHWKAIIVFIIIGAVIGGGYSYIRSSGSSSVGGVKTSLSETDKEVIALYLKYTELYEDQLEYIQSDQLLQIDPANTYRCSMIYYLGCDDAEKIDGIMQAYDMRLDELSDLYGKPNAFSIKKNQNTLITDDFSNVITGEGTNLVISVIVYGTDVADVNTKLDEVEDNIFSRKAQIEETFGKHTVIPFRGDMRKAPATGIIGRQKEAIDTLGTINTSMANIKKNLDEEMIEILDYCADEHPEYKEIDEIPNRISTAKVEEQGGSGAISRKMILLGAVAGLVIGIILMAIVYSVRGRIAPEDDMESTFGTPLLAAASHCVKKKKSGPDAGIDRIRHRRLPKTDEEGEAELAASAIRVSCRGKEIREIYVTGTSLDDELKRFVEKVAAKLKNDGIELTVGRSILVFPEALEAAADTGHVIFAERYGVSRFDEIGKEIRKCADSKIDITGIITAG